jgi:molybdenum cofactor cytidylyltransferase
MTEPRVAGIVLAAGSSRRLGANKLLVRLGGETVLRRAVRTARAAGLDPVCVVLGEDPERLLPELDGLPVVLVVNPEPGRGMSRSLREGVAALPDDVAGVAVLLADMPFVGAAMVRAVVEAAGDAPMAAASYEGVIAPPYFYRRALFAELLELDGDGCGKRVYKRHQAEAAIAPLPAAALADLDVPADVERARELLGGP